MASNPAVQEHDDEMSTDEQTHLDDWDDQLGDSPQNPGISLLASLDVWFLEGLEIVQGEATGEGTGLAIISADGCSEQGLSLPDLVGEMGETLFSPLQTIEKLPVRRIGKATERPKGMPNLSSKSAMTNRRIERFHIRARWRVWTGIVLSTR